MAAVKVTEVIGVPTDREAFERFDWAAYYELRRKLPGLERLEVARVVPPPDGGEPTVAVLSEGWFRDMQTLQRAHSSDIGTQVRASVAALRAITTVDVHVSVLDPSAGATGEHSKRQGTASLSSSSEDDAVLSA